MKDSEDTETKQDKKSATNKATDEGKRKKRKQLEAKEDNENPKSKKTKQPTESEPASEIDHLAEISDDKSQEGEDPEITGIPKSGKVVKKSSKKWSTKSLPVQNEAEESEDESYKCNICDKVFQSCDNYKEHKKNCTKFLRNTCVPNAARDLQQEVTSYNIMIISIQINLRGSNVNPTRGRLNLKRL